jgi:hypothetical protein
LTSATFPTYNTRMEEIRVCTICDDPKLLSAFGFRKERGRYYNDCRECRNKRAKKYKAQFGDKFPNLSKITKQKCLSRNREYVINYLNNHPCIDCGERDVVVLQFDHISGDKRREISHLVGNGYSIETIQKEIDKCQVVCANCHTKRTAKQFGYYRFLVKKE